jgi:hypothetical protein
MSCTDSVIFISLHFTAIFFNDLMIFTSLHFFLNGSFNTKSGSKHIGGECLNSIPVAQGNGQWPAPVGTVMRCLFV